MKKCIVLAAALLMTALAGCGAEAEISIPTDTPPAYEEFDWPKSEIAALIPRPESGIGHVDWEASYGFYIEVANTTQDDFEAYSSLCYDAGFNVDYRAGDDYFYASNPDGYDLSLYWEEGGVMSIRLDAPEEEEPESAAPAESAETPGEETVPETEPVSSEPAEGIRPEFKEAMDSYEAFFDEYIAFMKAYSESGNSLNMMDDYLSYMQKYVDMMGKLEALDDGSMSDEETLYYAEVMLRISQKLADAGL